MLLLLQTIKWGYLVTVAMVLLLYIFAGKKKFFWRNWLIAANYLMIIYFLLSIFGFISARVESFPRLPVSSEFPFPYNLFYEIIIPAVFIALFCFRNYRAPLLIAVLCAVFLLSDGFMNWLIHLYSDYLPSGWVIQLSPNPAWTYVKYFLLFQVMAVVVLFLMRQFRTEKKNQATNFKN